MEALHPDNSLCTACPCRCCGDDGCEGDDEADWRDERTVGTRLEQPCVECPFQRVSAAGWLGPWDADVLLTSLGHVVFPCHRTIPVGGEAAKVGDLESCAGAAIHLNHRLEMSRVRVTLAHQDLLRTAPAEIADGVFASRKEFLAHHNGSSSAGGGEGQ